MSLSLWRGQYLRNLSVVGLIILGVAIFHWRGLQPGHVFLPVDLANNLLPWRTGEYRTLQNRLISDPLYEFYPFVAHAVNTVRERGLWPLWNPHIFLGHPSLADPLAQTFYPVYLLLGLLIGAARGLTIGLWLHAVLAACFTYGLLRTHRCRPSAALVGAFSYALSGHFITWFENTHRPTTLTWLPGILWMFELAVQRRQWRFVVGVALMTLPAILGGQYQYLVAFNLFLGLYALGRSWQLAQTDRRWAIWPLGVMLIGVGFGGLLSAIQLLPFLEFLSLSQRLQSTGLDDPLPVTQLVTLIVPNFFGNPSLPGPRWGMPIYSEATIHGGLIALWLALTLLLTRPQYPYLYLGLLGLVMGYFISGGPGVSLLGGLPLIEFASLRRSAFILPLIIALLAAMALNQPRLSVKGGLVSAGVLLALVGGALYVLWAEAEDRWEYLQGPLAYAALVLLTVPLLLKLRLRFTSLVNWVFVGLVFVDLFLFGSRFNPVGPISELVPPTPSIDYLRQHAGLYRVAAYQHEILLAPNIPSIYGINEAGGYSSMNQARYRQLVATDDPTVWWMNENPNVIIFTRPSQRLLDLLQVGHVVSPVLLDDPGIRAVHGVEGCVGETEEVTTEQSISGSFAVAQTAINRFDLRFRVLSPNPVEGELVIRLWQGIIGERLVMEAPQRVEELVDQQTVTFYFTPELDAPGHGYTWEITAAEQTERSGVALCTAEGGAPSVSVYGSEHTLVHQSNVFVYERILPLPRAFIAYAAEPISDDEAAVQRLLDPTFDPRRGVVVAKSVSLPTETVEPIDRAEIISYSDTRVTIRGTAVQPGLLVLGDQDYPGWHVTINDQPAEIIRTNHVMRGVLLPAGEHEVVFQFAPESLRLGGLISAAGLVGLLAVALIGGRVNRSRHY